jgi:hypothetical protein
VLLTESATTPSPTLVRGPVPLTWFFTVNVSDAVAAPMALAVASVTVPARPRRAGALQRAAAHAAAVEGQPAGDEVHVVDQSVAPLDTCPAPCPALALPVATSVPACTRVVPV